MVAVEGGVDAAGEVVGGEQASGLGDAPFAVDPLRLDRVQPGALDGQVAVDDADPTPTTFDPAIVGADPVADGGADGAGGGGPDHQQGPFVRRPGPWEW